MTKWYVEIVNKSYEGDATMCLAEISKEETAELMSKKESLE